MSKAGHDQVAAELEANLEAEPERQWPFVVTLKHPVDFGDERIASLTFRRGKVGDAKGVKFQSGELPSDQLVLIASRMCGQPLKVIEMLDIDDAGEVMALVLDFYKRYLTAGRKR